MKTKLVRSAILPFDSVRHHIIAVPGAEYKLTVLLRKFTGWCRRDAYRNFTI